MRGEFIKLARQNSIQYDLDWSNIRLGNLLERARDLQQPVRDRHREGRGAGAHDPEDEPAQDEPLEARDPVVSGRGRDGRRDAPTWPPCRSRAVRPLAEPSAAAAAAGCVLAAARCWRCSAPLGSGSRGARPLRWLADLAGAERARRGHGEPRGASSQRAEAQLATYDRHLGRSDAGRRAGDQRLSELERCSRRDPRPRGRAAGAQRAPSPETDRRARIGAGLARNSRRDACLRSSTPARSCR